MKVDLDFTNVKSSGKIRVPEGDYIVKVKKVTKTKAKSSGNPMLVMDFQFLTGGDGVEGKTIQDNHTLTKNALWTLRNMLEAMGYNVPTGKMKFDDKMVVGKRVGITVIDGEEYKGRTSSEIADYISPKIVGNLTSPTEASEEDEGFLDDSDDSDDDSDDGMDTSDDSDDDSEDESDDDSDDDSDDGDFSFEDDDEEDEEEAVELSFDEDDVEEAKAAELKKFYNEATEAGFEFDLPSKPKAKQVREALLSLFAEEDEEDDDEFEEDFDLDDVE